MRVQQCNFSREFMTTEFVISTNQMTVAIFSNQMRKQDVFFFSLNLEYQLYSNLVVNINKQQQVEH